MKEITTIKISKQVVEELSRLKIHPRQSYEEVIADILQKYKNKLPENMTKNSAKSEITTIKISKQTVSELSKLKVHPRQSYEEVIVKLLEKHKERGK